MKTSVLFGLGLMVAAAAIVAVWSGSRSSAAPAVQSGSSTPQTPPTQRLGDVQVRHELITISPPVAPAGPKRTPAPGFQVARQGTPVRQAEVAARERPANLPLLEKARRAFIGDGRHKPEPFPRPRGN
jgi:hypothetical protein